MDEAPSRSWGNRRPAVEHNRFGPSRFRFRRLRSSHFVNHRSLFHRQSARRRFLRRTRLLRLAGSIKADGTCCWPQSIGIVAPFLRNTVRDPPESWPQSIGVSTCGSNNPMKSQHPHDACTWNSYFCPQYPEAKFHSEGSPDSKSSSKTSGPRISTGSVSVSEPCGFVTLRVAV